MTTTNKPPCISQRHYETQRLIERLKAGKAGDTLTDGDLQVICGRNCRPGGDGYGYLASAIDRVARDHGLHWKRQRGAGYIVCLGPTELVQVAGGELQGIHRRCRKTMRKLRAVDREQLTDSERSKHNGLVAQTATLALFSRSTTTKKLENRPEGWKPDIKRLAALFG